MENRYTGHREQCVSISGGEYIHVSSVLSAYLLRHEPVCVHYAYFYILKITSNVNVQLCVSVPESRCAWESTLACTRCVCMYKIFSYEAFLM